MLFKKALLPAVIMLALAGCGDARLDGSSPAAFDDSISKISSKLPVEQQPQFNEDIALVKSYYETNSPADLLVNFSGKNAVEVMAEANNLREKIRLEAERAAEEERQKAYRLELEDKRELLAGAVKTLMISKAQSEERALFTVQSASISTTTIEGTDEKSNKVELTISNGTSKEIYGAFFNASMTSGGEEQIILASQLVLDFEGGLQPGEVKTVAFKPSFVSEWRSVELPENPALKLELNELINVSNKPLFSEALFGPEEEKELERLKVALTAVSTELGVEVELDDPVVEAPAGAIDEKAVANEVSPPTVEETQDAAQPVTTQEDAVIDPQVVAEPKSKLQQELIEIMKQRKMAKEAAKAVE